MSPVAVVGSVTRGRARNCFWDIALVWMFFILYCHLCIFFFHGNSLLVLMSRKLPLSPLSTINTDQHVIMLISIESVARSKIVHIIYELKISNIKETYLKLKCYRYVNSLPLKIAVVAVQPMSPLNQWKWPVGGASGGFYTIKVAVWDLLDCQVTYCELCSY